MADIKPFSCIRPRADIASRIAALPYDIYDRAEAMREIEREPLSFLRIDLPETQFPEGTDPYAPEVYQKAHDILWDMVGKGQFVTEDAACYYVYELTMDGRVQDGIVGCASIDDYLGGVIKKHENTREDKEQDRIRHVDVCGAQTGPIFLAYRAKEEIRAIIAKAKQGNALYDFVSEDGIRHRVFCIDGASEIEELRQAFSGMDKIYIADGHHRAASAVHVGTMRRERNLGYGGTEEFNYFLSVLFPDDQLMIMDYNRLVRDLNGLSEEDFLEKVEEAFEVSPATEPRPKPREKGEISMFLGGRWYCCHVREGERPRHPVDGLDVSVLQDRLLAPVLGIRDPRTDARIDFVGGIRGLEELERRVGEDCAVAFAMFPTSIHELFDVADAGLLMPPKSTWFEPKLRSGLFIHKI